jgi:hypothetical protein
VADTNAGTDITGPASTAGAPTNQNGPAEQFGESEETGPADSSAGSVLTNPPNDDSLPPSVTKIIAGTNITIAPPSGVGVVTINAAGTADFDLMLYTVFVAKNGIDAGADGSVEKPFLTVQAAMQYAWLTYVFPLGPQPVSPFTRPCVFVNAGTYDDGPLVLPPQICVMGEGFNHTRIIGDWTIDARWATPMPDDQRSSWINVGLFGTIAIDFAPMASNEGKLYGQDCRFGGDCTFSEKLINPVSNQMIFTDCEFLGNLTLNGIPTILDGCITLGGTLTLNQQIGTGVDNTFASSGGSIGNIVVNSASGAAPPYVCQFGHSAQPGATLTLNGAFLSILADLSSLPLQSLITLAGGATLDKITRANQPNFSGTTAQRPAAPYVGQEFFDTTLGQPVWWDGINWITWSDSLYLLNDEAVAVPIGTPVYIDAANGFKKARSNALATAFPIGLVAQSTIASAAIGSVRSGGALLASTAQWDVVTGAVGGLTPGARYWLDPATAGRLTTTAPTTVGQFVTRVGLAASPTKMIIEIDDSVLL